MTDEPPPTREELEELVRLLTKRVLDLETILRSVYEDGHRHAVGTLKALEKIPDECRRAVMVESLQEG